MATAVTQASAPIDTAPRHGWRKGLPVRRGTWFTRSSTHLRSLLCSWPHASFAAASCPVSAFPGDRASKSGEHRVCQVRTHHLTPGATRASHRVLHNATSLARRTRSSACPTLRRYTLACELALRKELVLVHGRVQGPASQSRLRMHAVCIHTLIFEYCYPDTGVYDHSYMLHADTHRC